MNLQEQLDRLDKKEEEAIGFLRGIEAEFYKALDRAIADLDYRILPLPEYARRSLYEERAELLRKKALGGQKIQETIDEIEASKIHFRRDLIGEYKRVWDGNTVEHKPN